jgi:glycosyltransferase involved in cell wall biosynthesis
MGARERNFREVVMMVVEQTKIGGVTSLHTRRAGFDGSTSLNRAEPETEPGNHSAARALFLISPSTTPCGVEMFARRLAQTWTDVGLVEESVTIRGDVQNIFAVWKALDVADAVVMNLPIVAWKRVILTPLLAFAASLARGKKTILVAHEWDDLDWRRRLVLMVYALFARRVILSSPMVRAQYLSSGFARMIRRPTSVIPIPPNIERRRLLTASQIAEQIRSRRNDKIVIGHFGSIYPKKQSDFVLSVAAEMKSMGLDVLVVFVGAFIKGLDSVEEDFNRQLDLLKLRNDVIVTGYVERPEEIFTLFEEVDCFLYRFTEGLSSRRSSVLACLQTGKPVLVNAPMGVDEFNHHRMFSFALDNEILRLLPISADAKTYATAIATSSPSGKTQAIEMYDASWRDAVYALEASAGPAAD